MLSLTSKNPDEENRRNQALKLPSVSFWQGRASFRLDSSGLPLLTLSIDSGWRDTMSPGSQTSVELAQKFHKKSGFVLSRTQRQEYFAAVKEFMRQLPEGFSNGWDIYRCALRLQHALRGGKRIYPTDIRLALSSAEGQVTSLSGTASEIMVGRLRERYEMLKARYCEVKSNSSKWEMERVLSGSEKRLQRAELLVTAIARGGCLAPVAANLEIEIPAAKRLAKGALPANFPGLTCKSRREQLYFEGLELGIAKDPEFAGLLGAMSAALASGINKRRICFTLPTEAARQFVCDALEKRFSAERWSVRARERMRASESLSVVIYCQPLARTFNRLTMRGRSIPAVSLGSREEKLAFLRGFCLCRSSIDRTQFSIRSKKDRKRLIELAVLMSELGVPPLFEQNSSTRIVVTDKLGLTKLRDMGIYRGDPREAVLNDAISRRTGNTGRSLEEYQSVRRFRTLNPHSTLRAIEEGTGVPVSTFRSWLPTEKRAASIPPFVKRYNQIKELASSMNIMDTDIFGEVCRQLLLSPAAAAELIRAHRPAAILAALKVASDVNTESRRSSELCISYQRIIRWLEQSEQNPSRYDVFINESARYAHYHSLVKWARDLGLKPEEGTYIPSLVKHLLDQYEPMIRRIFRRTTAWQSGLDLDDLRSFAAIRIEAILRSYDPTVAAFSTYSYRYVEVALANFASGQRKKELSLDKQNPETEEALSATIVERREKDPAELSAQSELIERIISECSDIEREIVQAIFFDGTSAAELARRHGVSRQAISLRLNALKIRMRSLLSE